jgi:hypothetical protein
VVFDADESLIDLRPAVRRALLVVLAEMRRLEPAAQGLSLADLEQDGEQAFAELRTEPVETARREALARSLARGIRFRGLCPCGRRAEEAGGRFLRGSDRGGRV